MRNSYLGSSSAEFVLRVDACARALGCAVAGWIAFAVTALPGAGFAQQANAPLPDAIAAIAAAFAREVSPRLQVPVPEQSAYAQRLQDALDLAGTTAPRPQFFLLVDRSAAVQGAFVYWRSEEQRWHLIGASAVSTGRPGAFEYFLTPLGVFAHTIANMDFRAEGTVNAFGIRGYGEKGMRIFDFGWVPAERTWGRGGFSPMRLQMHATDPDLLQRWLGERRSKGCIRISATLNVFIDRYGLLDADYARALGEGKKLWVLRADRTPTPWSGRYLVIVDSMRESRPHWAPAPGRDPPKPRIAPRTVMQSAASVC